MFKKTGGGFLLVGLLVACCAYVLSGLPDNVQTGIDLAGGTELVYDVPIEKVSAARRATAIDDIKNVLAERFDAYGVKELSIAKRGSSSLVIQVPSTENEEIKKIKDGIENAGRLTIHLISQEPEHKTKEGLDKLEHLQREWDREWTAIQNRKAAGENIKDPEPLAFRVVKGEKEGTRIVVHNSPGTWVDGKLLKQARAGQDEKGAPAVHFEFNDQGAAQFAALTEANIGKPMAIVLDGAVKNQATIRSRISANGQISGGTMDRKEVEADVTLLNSGSLPITPIFDSENRVGSLLGEESKTRGQQALIVGFLFVLVFMVVYYQFSLGGVAAVSLLFNLVLVLTALIVFRNSLTLPGMAGFLLTVGMSVDANILIYERIREERKRGRGLSQSIAAGYSRAFSTIFDANLTTLITAGILFKFGTGPVKGFAVVLAVGIVTSFFTAVYLSRLVISFLVHRGIITDTKMLEIISDTKFDFLSRRGLAKKLSMASIAVGLIVLCARGTDSLGIDFTGGSRVVVKLNEPHDQAEIEGIVHALGSEYKDAPVQPLGEGDDAEMKYAIRTRVTTGGTTTDQHEFKELVEKAFGEQHILAPSTFANEEQPLDSGGPYRATVYMRKLDGELTAAEVKAALAESFPVDSVADTPKIGRWQGFEITSKVPSESDEATKAPDDGYHAALQERLTKYEKSNEDIELADPFPEVSSIGSRVARDMQSQVFVAMILAFAAIIFYISLRFEFKFGLAAVVALVHDISFTLGALAVGDLLFGSFLNLKINLPVVAALLTVVGYSLNDTIVIFDRIRENLEGKRRDADWEEIVNAAINQTLSRTILTSVTTFVVVSVLLVWGGAALRGFSFAMCCGVVVGTYSSIYVASPVLLYFHRRQIARREMLMAEAQAASR